MIDELKDHFIICGYGRVGRRAADEFDASGQPFVVLDFSPTGARARAGARRPLPRRAAEPKTTISCAPGSIARAACSLRRTPTPRTSTSRSRRATRRSGADDRRARLRSRGGAEDPARGRRPSRAAVLERPGSRWPSSRSKPQVAAFLELVSSHARADLHFEEIEVPPAARSAGRIDPRAARQHARPGADRVALRKPDGTFDMTPKPDVTHRGRRRR